MNRDEIIEALKRNVVVVDFTKTNGEHRVMRCTLQPTLLPDQETESGRPFNESVVAAWDVEKNGWRSFRLDNVNTWHEEVTV